MFITQKHLRSIEMSKVDFYEGTNLVREESYKNGENTFIATYKYDEKGNLIDNNEFEENGKLARNKHYEYVEITK